MNKQELTSSRRQFAKIVRMAFVWVIAAWCILTIEHVLASPLGHDKFETPTPPFQAVSAGHLSTTPNPTGGWALNFYKDIVRVWLYY